ncbi:hypothetical protein G6F23_013614 [Rhizopus arrhizus]|nr:hypothetical protein G6F23_013614 [Rhizopus arrhizus]
MHAGQHAGAHQEGAEQGQREGGDRQQQGPAAEGAALFGDRLRVDQCCTNQPRHEAGVLHRVPEPPAAPAQLVATLVHGRVQRSQRASTRPSSSAATANANGTAKPT